MNHIIWGLTSEIKSIDYSRDDDDDDDKESSEQDEVWSPPDEWNMVDVIDEMMKQTVSFLYICLRKNPTCI